MMGAEIDVAKRFLRKWSRIYTRRSRLVEEGHFLGRRYLKPLEPSEHGVSFYGRILQAPALNSVEENISWHREIVQLNSSAKGSGCQSQGVSLRPSPRAPLYDYREVKCEKSLNQLPLQSFDLLAAFFIGEA